MTGEILDLCRWVASYYFCGWGEVLNSSLPGGMGLLLRQEFVRKRESLPGVEMLGKPLQNLVSTKERWSLKDWNRNQPGNEEKKFLAEWLRQGHLEKVQTFAGQRSRPKMERWVRLLNPEAKGAPKRKKTKKVQILEKLKQSPESSWEEIRSSIPNLSLIHI